MKRRTVAALTLTIPATLLAAEHDVHRTEWRASTFPLSTQAQGTCEIDEQGNLIVAWSSRRQQAGHYGVYAQRFDHQGIALGTETQLNLWTTAHQVNPVIANAGERTWFAWQSHNQDGDAGAVIARPFDAAFQGHSEVQVNLESCGHQSAPAIAALPDGSIVATWIHQSSDLDQAQIHVQKLDAQGTPLGRMHVISIDNQLQPALPAIATAPDGTIALAYAVADVHTGETRGIQLQQLNTLGEPIGATRTIADSASTGGIEPVIASAGERGWIVAWLDRVTDGNRYGVVAQRLNLDGSPAADAFMVNDAHREGTQNGAAIAVRHDGTFTIAFNSADSDGVGVFAQTWNADGSKRGDTYRINDHTEGNQALDIARTTQRLAYGNDGALYCVWNGDAGLGDSSSINVTMITDAPAPETTVARGVRETMLPAMLPGAINGQGNTQAAAMAKPHRPPTFDPKSVQDNPREIMLGPGGAGFTGVNNTGWTPPDPQMAVGPNHIVAVTNGAIAVLSKTGDLLFQDEIEDSFGFWGEVGATGFVFDPEALYDTVDNRYWVMAAEAFAPGGRSYVLIAVSDDDNPLGTWYKYRLETTGFAGNLFDSPNIGVDAAAVYVTGDGFGSGSNYPVYIWDKASMLAGNPPAVEESFVLPTSTQSAGIPPVSEDTAGTCYMVEHQEGSSVNGIRLIALTEALTNPSTETFTLTVPTYGNPGDPDQGGTSATVETFDSRFWSVCQRGDSLWATHHADFARVRVRWYQIALNGWPFTDDNPTLVQSGIIDPGPGIYTFFSAISADDAGNAMVTYARSSSSEFFSMNTAYRYASDPLGTMRPGQMHSVASGPYTAGRWGDYAAVEVDPADGKTFWSHHESANGSSWFTWIQSRAPLFPTGDVDCNGIVDVEDLLALLAAWGPCPGCSADIDGNGTVDVDDLLALLANWGSSV